MKKIALILSFFLWFKILLFSQVSPCTNCSPSTSAAKRPHAIIQSGNQALATSYTRTACGLNFVYASNPLFARAGNNFTFSVAQPAPFAISGIPPCAVIEKAFLYVGTSGDSIAIVASVVNPGLGGSIFNMTAVGSGPDKNWGFNGSYTYMADVTSIISGNGSYTLSGIPTSTAAPGDDANGALLIVIYSDRSQNYSGSIVIADGSLVNADPTGAVAATIAGFNVCGNVLSSLSFMLVDDMQQYDTTQFSFNSAVPNFTQLPVADQPWTFFTDATTTLVTGQSTADFGLINAADTMGILVAGLYYQSDCLVCPEQMQLTATSTPSCLATATVVVSGGVGPYTYVWTGSGQTTPDVTGLSAGTHSVIVSDNLACLVDTVTFTAVTPANPITVTNGTFCVGYSTNLSVGNAASYTWNPSATLDSPNIQNVVASPLSTTIYTVDYADVQGCTGVVFAQAFVTTTQTISISNNSLCAGATINLSTNTFTGNGYVWTGPLGFTSTLQNPVILNASTGLSGSYNLSVTTIPGCTSTAVSQVNVTGLPNATIGNSSPICANTNVTLTSSGGSTYNWTSANGFVSAAQNPTILAATAADAGTYSVTVSFGNGCSRTVSTTVVVNALPTPSVAAPEGTNVCVGRPVIFSGLFGGSYAWSGPNGFASSQQSNTINAVTMAADGVYTLTVTNPNNCQASVTHTVVVLQNPTVTVLSPTPCLGSPATFSIIGSGFYDLFGPNNFALTNNFSALPTVSVANLSALGIYTVVLSSLNNTCTARATSTLTVKPLPFVSATGTFVCLNSPATLTATGGISYDWKGPATYTAAGSTPSVSAVNPLTAGVYSVLVTAVNTCTGATTATIGAIQLPTVTATGTILCLNEPFTMLAGGASTYTWTGPSGYSSIGSSAFIPTVVPLTSGIYTVFGRAANSCTGTTTSLLGTLPLPGINTIGASVCINYSALLQASGGLSNGTGYKWTGPGGYLSFAQNAVIPVATNVVPQTYTVVGTSANSCTNIAFATLATFPTPIINATPLTVCYGYPATIFANGASTYTWAGPNSNNFSGSANNFIPVVDSLSRGTYTVYGTSVNGCTNVAMTNINTQPIPAIITTSTAVCFLQSATLTATGGVSGSYMWGGPNGFTSNQQSPVISVANNVAPQIYTVIATGVNSCTNSATAVLKTYPLPQPSYNATSTVCMGDYVTLQALGANSYTWSGPRRYLAFTKDVSFPTFNTGQAGVYTLNVIDSRGCKNFTTALVSINALPEGDLVNNNTGNNCVPFCADFRVKRSTASPIITTIWSVNNILYPSETFNYCRSIAGTDKVFGKFTDAAGCVNTMSFAITSYPVPVANFSTTPDKPVETNDPVFFEDHSVGENMKSWRWSFLKSDSLISYSQNTSYLFEDAGQYAVVLNIENIWGCRDSSSKLITIDTDVRLFVPNTFTPDNDGLNDVFKPKGRGIAKYVFEIYNRWDEKIFETSDFEKGWDGKLQGKECPNDVYVWRVVAVDIKGKRYDLNGRVTLLK